MSQAAGRHGTSSARGRDCRSSDWSRRRSPRCFPGAGGFAARWYPLAVPALFAAAILALRFLATRRALRSRIRLAVVPAEDFDLSLDAVVRFAAQLSRVRRSVRGWLDRRASAVRVRVEPDRDGRVAYSVEAPGRARELLLAALRSYEPVRLVQSRESSVSVPISETPFTACSGDTFHAWEATPPMPGRGRASAARPLNDLRGDRSSTSPLDPVPGGAKSAASRRRFGPDLDLVRGGGAPALGSHTANPPGKLPLCGGFWKWRGPESNRGHHDFQAVAVGVLRRRKPHKDAVDGGAGARPVPADAGRCAWV
jgi:hypothetical protein